MEKERNGTLQKGPIAFLQYLLKSGYTGDKDTVPPESPALPRVPQEPPLPGHYSTERAEAGMHRLSDVMKEGMKLGDILKQEGVTPSPEATVPPAKKEPPAQENESTEGSIPPEGAGDSTASGEAGGDLV